MAGASVKMGVDVTQFKQGMRDAQASVKTLDAELKKSEAQLKQTGDKEQYAADKSTILQQKLNAQKTAAANCEKALKAMADNGVKESSEEYQKLARQLAETQAGMVETTTALNQLTVGEQAAAKGATELTQSVNSIGKKISLDQVITGIDKITSGMEKAARKAVDLGKAIWENITDSARWSDDVATQAMVLGMDVEEYQKYKGVFDTIGEITVAEWQKAKLKVEKAMYDPTNEQLDILRALGIGIREGGHAWQNNYRSLAMRSFEDVFWDIGKALKEKVESGQMTEGLADTYANAIFGRGFAQLNPLFELGKEGFAAAVEEQAAASAEAIAKNAEFNDKLIQLQETFNALKAEVTSGLTPALTEAANVLNGLLNSLLEYVKKPEGQEMLEKMGTAVSGLFDDLKNIEPEKVIQNLASVFENVVKAFEWISDHWEGVVTGIKAIGAAFVGLKIAEAGLTFLQFANGLKGLFKGGTPTVTSGGGGGSGTASSGGGLTEFFTSTFPWLSGKISSIGTTLASFDPSGTLALLPQWLMDNTIVGRNIQNGTPLGEAISKIPETFVASAKEGLNNFTKYFTEQIPEAFWRLFGIKDWKATAQKASENLKVSGDWTLGDDVTAEEAMALVSTGEKTAQEAKEKLEKQLEESDKAFEEIWDKAAKGIEEIGKTSGKDAPKITVEPEVPENAGEMIAEQVGPVVIPATVQITSVGGGTGGGYSYGGGSSGMQPINSKMFGDWMPHANGIWSVPWDGYPAILHKNERVIPAYANTYNASSNLYVDHMYMNNGMDAQALASAMRAQNERVRAGFGS